MPDISVFCPACGRSTSPGSKSEGSTSQDSTGEGSTGHDPTRQEELAATDSLDRAFGAIAYLALLPPLIFLLIPAFRRRRLVRFHSWQSLMFSAAMIVLGGVFRLFFLVFSVLPVVGFLVAWLLLGIGSLAVFILWVVLVVKAAQGRSFELPVIGPWAAQLAWGTASGTYPH